MPLLGKKVVHLVKPLSDVDPNETIYTITHTKEQFRSKEEYEKRLGMYADAVWTCQCTGHIQLTHEEAYRSEQEKFSILRNQFPKYFEKIVLQLVHHNTEILDNLVDQAWTKIQQAFAVGETVAMKAKAQGKSFRGDVVKIDTSDVVNSPTENGLPNGNCSSPSSDKENAASNNTPSEVAQTKWVHPKLLEYKYSLKLEDDQIVHGIPANDLQRTTRPPSKDLVKLFIRSFALRHGSHPNSPWVVNENHVKEYGLKSKYADFLVSPQKMAELTKKTTGEKRKRQSTSKEGTSMTKKSKLNTSIKSPKQSQLTLTTLDGSAKKRGRPPKTANSTPKSSPKRPQTPKKSPQKTPAKSPQKKAANKTPTKAKTGDTESSSSSSSDSESDSDSSEDIALSKLKESNMSTTASPTKAASGSPRKRSLADLKRDMEENTPLSQLRSPVNSSQEGTPKKKRGRPRKSESTPDPVPKKRGRPRKDASEKGTPVKSAGKSPAKGNAQSAKKGMKQITLFDLKGKERKTARSPAKNQPKSPRKPQTPVRLPPIVTKLRKALKTKDNSNRERSLFYNMLKIAAEKLTKKQQAILPDDIRDILLEKIAALEEKKRLQMMTPEERAEYMKQKRKENAKKKAKVEDTYLTDLKPLPMPKLVPTPDGIANELFGDVVMITEFVNCYKGLIMPEDPRVFNAYEAMKSLAGGEDKFLYLGQMLQVLLQTLLQDGIAQDYRELGMALANITVTPYSTAELVRLCLRENDEDSDSSSSDDEDSDDDKEKQIDVPSELVEQLETSELWSLSPEEKLGVIKGLCNRLMNSYSVQNYMMECQQSATEKWRRRLKHGYSKTKLENMKKTMEEEEEKVEEPQEENKTGMTLKDFYGKDKVESEESSEDLASVVKRRRVMAVRAVEEKRRRDMEERKRREIEANKQRELRDIETFEKDFAEALNTAKLVLRQTPVGTDRDHNRYWQFLGAAPGLYIEKGWVGCEMEYQVGRKKDTWDSSDSESESDSDAEKRGRKPKEDSLRLEKTAPHVGQNLWFCYDNIADINSLLERLHPRGVRETNLLGNIKKIYPSIELDFKGSSKSKENVKEETETEPVASNLEEGMRQDLLDVEMRLRNGGLGGVDNYTDWEKNIKTAKTIQEFGALLIETQNFIPGKFMKGFLGPEGMSKKKEKEKKPKEEEEEEKDEEKTAEEDIHVGLERWKEAIASCTTFSRLHVLLGMLDSCVKWERSMENAKCKVCRRKGDEFLLCDECNQPFHLYCLRPALPCAPEGDWFCPGCVPLSQRKNSRNKDYRRMAEGSGIYGSENDESDQNGDEQGEEEEDGERQVELNCIICGGDEGLITCSSCPSSFHFECHNPPLRREPRSIWKCQQCVTGIRIRRTKTSARPKRSTQNRRTYSYDRSSSEEDSEEEEDDDDDEEEDQDSEDEGSESSYSETNKVSKSRNSRQRNATRRPIVENDVDSDEDEEGEDEEESDGGENGSSVSSIKPPSGKKLEELLKNVMNRITRHRCAWPFIEPVNRAEVPDYYDIVKNPITLQDMKVKIMDGDYQTGDEFVEDMARMFDNADLYNKRDSVVGKCIEPLEKCFVQLKEKFFPDSDYWREEQLRPKEKEIRLFCSDSEDSS